MGDLGVENIYNNQSRRSSLRCKTKSICVLTTNWTCQNSIATPSYKNIVGYKIMNQPLICNTKVDFFFWSESNILAHSRNCFNSSIKGFSIMLMCGPEWSGPGMMRHRNIYSCFMQRQCGRLYRIAKMSQHEYNEVDEL
jgi:hypothetical protein